MGCPCHTGAGLKINKGGYLNWISWNCDTLTPQKAIYLEGIISDHDIHVLMLSETRKPKNKLPRIKGFSIVSVGYAEPRENAKREHNKKVDTLVAIYVDSNLTASKANYVLKREHGSSSCSAEVFITHPRQPGKTTIYHFTSVYYRPRTSHKIDVQQFLNIRETEGKKYIISGDFNDHASAWSNQPNADESTRLSDMLESDNCPLICLNDKRITRVPRGVNVNTHNPSALDLTFVSTSLGASEWSVLTEHLYISDHFPIYGSIPTGGDTNAEPPEDKFNLDKADWEKLQGYLINNAIDIDNVQISDQYGTVNEAIMGAAKEAIPVHKQKGKYKGQIWWNEDCDKAKKQLKQCSQTLFINLTIENYDKWKDAEREYTKTISLAKLSHWEQTLKDEIRDYRDSKILWRKVKQIRRGKTPHKRPMYFTDNQGNKHLCVSDKDKANLLAAAIAQKSQNRSLTDEQKRKRAEFEANYVDPKPDNTLEFNQPITLTELDRAISDIRDKNKASGADKVTYKIIEMVPYCTKQVILKLFNNCLAAGELPSQWKDAQVFALKKQGKDATNPDSYRPISLTPHMGKIFERIIKERLERFLDMNGILPESQSGFRAARSTTDNLVFLTERMKQALRWEHTARYVTLFDIHKAFDRVWHCKLLAKLKEIGISGNMYNVIKSFLSDRTMSVKYGNELSESHKLDMGSPQGAVLSPLLFLVLLHDIEKVRLGDNELLLYADDICLISKIAQFNKGYHDKKVLSNHQQAINNLSQYLSDNGLTFSGEKTQFMAVSRKRDRHNCRIYVNGAEVKHQDHIKYLGLTFSHNLSWTKHFRSIKEKVRSHINLLRVLSTERWAKGTKFLVNVARSLVRSCVSYGQECFFSAPQADLNKLTNLEYSALRVALGVDRCTKGSPEIYREAGWLTLTEERKLRCAQFRVRMQKLPDHVLNKFSKDDKYRTSRILTFQTKGRKARKAKEKNKELVAFKATETLFEHTDAILKAAGLPLDNVEQIQVPYFPVRTEPVYITHHTLVPGTKKSDDTKGAGATANIYIDTHFSDYFQLYTDGSLQEGRGGFGLWFKPPPGHALKPGYRIGRIEDGHCIMTLELAAIANALQFILEENSGTKKYVVLTDSLSSLQALGGKIKSCYQLQNKIKYDIDLIQKQGKIVSFCHVPSHSGVIGNENADDAAVAGAKAEKPNCSLPYTRNEAYKLILDALKTNENLCPDLQDRVKTGRLKGIYPDGPAEVTLTYRRIKLNNPKFKVYNIIHNKETKCPFCSAKLSLEHLFDTPCDMVKQELKKESALLCNNNSTFSAALKKDSNEDWMLAYTVCKGILHSGVGHLI